MEIVVGLFLGLYIGSKIDELNDNINRKHHDIVDLLTYFKEDHQTIFNEIRELKKEIKGED